MANSASTYYWVRPFSGTIGTSSSGNCSCEASYKFDSINVTQIADNITLTSKIDNIPAGTAYDTINITQRADNITNEMSHQLFARNNNYPNGLMNVTNLSINTCIDDVNSIASICFIDGVVVVSG
jgi:hypothetical protein